MTWKLHQIPSQKGRTAIVTGANTGLGYETALELAGKDMQVILACRNMEKANNAKEKMLQKYPQGNISCLELDLSKLSSVKDFASNFIKNHQKLDLLINNAGIMMTPYSRTVDGFESQMGTNYFGHFLLTQLLLDTLNKTPESRVVSLSSLAHRSGKIHFDDIHFEKKYSPMGAYAQTKLACLIYAYELQRRLEKAGSSTISLAAHPGISLTELTRYLPKWTILLSPVISLFMAHKPSKGALPTLRAALDDAAQGGDYYGPDGYREYKGKPVKVRSRRMAQNEEIGRKLWELSEDLTGANYGI